MLSGAPAVPGGAASGDQFREVEEALQVRVVDDCPTRSMTA
jgi:hypothetical protein